MRTISTLIFIVCLGFVTKLSAQSNAETLTGFLNGIINFENVTINDGTPIIDIKKLASEQAALSKDLTKESVKEVLETAKNYHFCVITVGDHTIARITDLEFTQMSASWAAAMPMGEGYIQNRGLIMKNDFLNNIIGTPDSRERKVYFFNKK